MHPDIERAITLIDHQVLELQKAKKVLLETFGDKNIQDLIQVKPTLPFPKQNRGTRKEAVVKILQDIGPLTRGEILRKTNIPLGTISTILNDKTSFKNKNGKWSYIAEVESTEENPFLRKDETSTEKTYI